MKVYYFPVFKELIFFPWTQAQNISLPLLLHNLLLTPTSQMAAYSIHTVLLLLLGTRDCKSFPNTSHKAAQFYKYVRFYSLVMP